MSELFLSPYLYICEPTDAPVAKENTKFNRDFVGLYNILKFRISDRHISVVNGCQMQTRFCDGKVGKSCL